MTALLLPPMFIPSAVLFFTMVGRVRNFSGTPFFFPWPLLVRFIGILVAFLRLDQGKVPPLVGLFPDDLLPARFLFPRQFFFFALKDRFSPQATSASIFRYLFFLLVGPSFPDHSF